MSGANRIEMQSFKDAAMTATGSAKSSTFLKDGAIYHQAGTGIWVAEHLSRNDIAFTPRENARLVCLDFCRVRCLDGKAEFHESGRKNNRKKFIAWSE